MMYAYGILAGALVVFVVLFIKYKEKYHNFRAMVAEEQLKNHILREANKEMKFELDVLAFKYAKLLDENMGTETQALPLGIATIKANQLPKQVLRQKILLKERVVMRNRFFKWRNENGSINN